MLLTRQNQADKFFVMRQQIELGDVGFVKGRLGLFCVCGGAKPPENVESVSESAKADAVESLILTLTDGSTCHRDEFDTIPWPVTEI